MVMLFISRHGFRHWRPLSGDLLTFFPSRATSDKSWCNISSYTCSLPTKNLFENFARKSLEDRLTAAFVLKLMNPIKNETFDVFIPFVRILYFLHPGPPSPSPSPRPRHPSISSFSSSSLFFFLLLFPSFPFFFLLFPSFSFFSLLFPFSPLFSPRWQGTARGACGAREAPWGARPKANAFSAFRGIRSLIWSQINDSLVYFVRRSVGRIVLPSVRPRGGLLCISTDNIRRATEIPYVRHMKYKEIGTG